MFCEGAICCGADTGAIGTGVDEGADVKNCCCWPAESGSIDVPKRDSRHGRKPLSRAVDPLTWEPLLVHQLRLRVAISPKIARMAALEGGKDIAGGT